jgi:hypothetical protein
LEEAGVYMLAVYDMDYEGSKAHENMLPRAPPSKTMSYLESMGRANDALYALRYWRMCTRTVGDWLLEENDVGASRFR